MKRLLSMLPALLLLAALATALSPALTVAHPASADADDSTAKPKKAPKVVRIGKIDWYVDYEEARLLAQQQNKPLWVHFGENPG